MTETDKIYVALIETMKKYSAEQAIGALSKYIGEGNARYFTSTNNARSMIMELTPAQVMKDALISSIKYEQIMREKGYAQVLPNHAVVEEAIQQYYAGQPVSRELTSGDIGELVIRMTSAKVGDMVQILARNPKLFDTFLSQYAMAVCNCRAELNAIPNDGFPGINAYFAQFSPTQQRQKA